MSRSATPATQSEGRCHEVPRLPRKTPRRHSAMADQARHQSQPSAISATPATQSNNRCRQVPRLQHKAKVDVTKCHAWLWWRAWFPFGAVGAAAVGVAGVALGGIDGHFAGRRGTWRHGSPLCVAGVALGDIDLHFAWPAWHLRHWAGSGGALGSRLAPWAPRLFAWQAWRLSTHNLLSHNLSHTQLAHKFMFTSPLSSNVFLNLKKSKKRKTHGKSKSKTSKPKKTGSKTNGKTKERQKR